MDLFVPNSIAKYNFIGLCLLGQAIVASCFLTCKIDFSNVTERQGQHIFVKYIFIYPKTIQSLKDLF